jgi:hypothetical protein
MTSTSAHHQRLTTFGVHGIHGYRTCELWQGDITSLPVPVDLLVVSALRGSYLPTERSIIGALHRRGVDVAALAASPDYDFRKTSLGCWVSTPFQSPSPKPSEVSEPSLSEGRPAHPLVVGEQQSTSLDTHQARILCIETTWGAPFDAIDRAFSHLFGVHALLEQQLSEANAIRTLAIPALGTGIQGFDVHRVAERIVTLSRSALEHSRFLERIFFVAFDEPTAARFCDAIEARIERIRMPLASERLWAARRDAAGRASNLLGSGRLPNSSRAALEDLHRLLLWSDAGNFELAIAGRRVAELVVEAKLGKVNDRKDDLLRRIERLAEHHVADWVRSYLHTLRVFGNDSAHAKHADSRIPSRIDERDIELWCLSLHRILDFWQSIAVNSQSPSSSS